MSDPLFTAAAPEVAIPMEVGKQVLPYAPSLAMAPIIVFSLFIIFLAILILSYAKHKEAGYLLFLFGLLSGGGALFAMYKLKPK